MKKNGFSLIGLLACVVLLAIIAAIVTPNITNMLKPSKLEDQESGVNLSFELAKVSATTYIQAIEWYYYESQLDSTMYQIPKNENIYVNNCNENICINNSIEIKGKKPIGEDDFIRVDNSGIVVEASLTFDQQKLTYKDGVFTIA